MSGASVRRPLLWFGFGPSPVCFFFSLAFSGFARSGLGVLVLVFAPFFSSFASPVSCSGSVVGHFTAILISSSFSSHPCPAAAGRVCVCVCVTSEDVKLLPCFLCCDLLWFPFALLGVPVYFEYTDSQQGVFRAH